MDGVVGVDSTQRECWCGLHLEGGTGVGSTWRARLGRKRKINLFIFLKCLVALILSSVSYYFRACSFTGKLLRKDYREIQEGCHF